MQILLLVPLAPVESSCAQASGMLGMYSQTYPEYKGASDDRELFVESKMDFADLSRHSDPRPGRKCDDEFARIPRAWSSLIWEASLLSGEGAIPAQKQKKSSCLLDARPCSCSTWAHVTARKLTLETKPRLLGVVVKRAQQLELGRRQR